MKKLMAYILDSLLVWLINWAVKLILEIWFLGFDDGGCFHRLAYLSDY
ncbi:MAG: hypothetical protein ACLRWM_08625 [Streptococcus sp.]